MNEIKLPTLAADLLAEAGRALYGEQWMEPFARAVNVNPRSLRDWLSGRDILDPHHAVVKQTLRLLQTRRDAADRAARQIAELIRAGS